MDSTVLWAGVPERTKWHKGESELRTTSQSCCFLTVDATWPTAPHSCSCTFYHSFHYDGLHPLKLWAKRFFLFWKLIQWASCCTKPRTSANPFISSLVKSVLELCMEEYSPESKFNGAEILWNSSFPALAHPRKCIHVHLFSMCWDADLRCP